MTFGIFSLDSANALRWFDSEEAAFHGVRQILADEPGAIDSVGVMAFDEQGHPVTSWHGQELMSAVRRVHA